MKSYLSTIEHKLNFLVRAFYFAAEMKRAAEAIESPATLSRV